jgi:3-oxoadipate enol-lactonase
MAKLGWQIDGPETGPLLVMGSSLGTTRAMWRKQVAPLSRHLRVLRYDHRGHGESAVPAGSYTLDDLGADLLELLDAVAPGERVHYAGLSLGGMVGMWLAIHAPERLGRLALVCTSAHMPPPENWTTRAETVLNEGMEAIADVGVGRWFTPAFAAESPEVVAEARAMLTATSPVGYAGCCAAIAVMDQRVELSQIGAPTLVVSALDDPSAPPDHGQVIARAIPGSRFEVIPGAHISAFESADIVTGLLLDHFAGATTDSATTDNAAPDSAATGSTATGSVTPDNGATGSAATDNGATDGESTSGVVA